MEQMLHLTLTVICTSLLHHATYTHTDVLFFQASTFAYIVVITQEQAVAV